MKAKRRPIPYGMDEEPERVLPKVSPQKLAKMAGTTRSRADYFMKKFKRLWFYTNKAVCHSAHPEIGVWAYH